MQSPGATDDRGTVVSGQTVRHGPGVTANRAFPTDAYPSSLDPFVLFERFSIEPGRGFPMHRHEGFEIVTYMLGGGMDHADSLGVEHTASANEAMHITAGAGIEHSEFPADDAACNGLQLWINLPREAKTADPDYADATADDLPTETLDGATVTTVVGEGSPLEPRTPMQYVDVRVTDAWTWSPDDGWAGFVYGIDGSGRIVDTGSGRDGADRSGPDDAAAFGAGDVRPITDGSAVELRSDGTMRVVAVAGRPHDEPIRLRGPVVR
ncbi:pirin family protein [Halovivax cerinus]|uniref:Pirin family protein n=1 Tax=Halovivax cerinus TaxID=1487865 RepID=A0ABD5NJ36_9EURY|nr:pirin family protein [Halovivax cerinus]